MMVNELGSSNPVQRENNDGFSSGTAVSSFAGALVAVLVGGGIATVLWPQATIVTSDGGAAVFAEHETKSVHVTADGVEEFVHIDGMPASVELSFEEAGTYRVELRALDGSSDPVLTLYATASDVPVATNDDAPGTLDAILPLRVADAADTWRVELTSFGETNGPGVLRVLPAAEGEDFSPLMTTGPGAFPSDDIAVLTTDEPTEATVGQDGVWYKFQPAASGVHILSVRAADENFDTVASLIPVLPGREAPLAGTDINTLSSAFTSDDDDGLNPRFARYLQGGADYYLFVRGFEPGTEGSIAISLELAGADTVINLQSHTEEVFEHQVEEHEEMAPAEEPAAAPGGGSKLNIR